uniref:IQ motif containing B1 n=1 Tax=Knipowitschia caucasica TaxID=637954 RepID=A0AAV2L737_KNICA
MWTEVLHVASLQTGGTLSRLKCRLFESGVLSGCVSLLEQRHVRGEWSGATALAQTISSCCVGADPGDRSEAFDRLFLPSVISTLLSLAARIMKLKCVDLLQKILDSVSWILQTHTHLSAQVLSSRHYEMLQICEEASVSLLCVQLWTHTCSHREFLSRLTNDCLSLLLNDVISQLAVSTDAEVGGACVRLMLVLAHQLKARLPPLLQDFRGLDRLLDNDWRGQGFDQEVDQLINIVQSSESMEQTERVRAACVIQAFWRSHRTRRRVKSLRKSVKTLQTKYRSHRQQQQKQQEAKLWEETLRYQVDLRRQQARRNFHLKQRQLLQLLPPEQVGCYLQQCELQAAELIQSQWRGFTQRRRFKRMREERDAQRREERAAAVIQRAVRHFLSRRRSAKIPPSLFWIGQRGLTDRRRAELKKQVHDYITLHTSSRVSVEECLRLHGDVQQLLASQSVVQQRIQEQRIEALKAQSNTLLRAMRDAPALSAVTHTQMTSFLSGSTHIAARARDSHNALLQAQRFPWWRRSVIGPDAEENQSQGLSKLVSMMCSLPRCLSMPRGMSLAPPPGIRRSVAITLTTACRAPVRLLQDVLSVCDHQTSHSGLCCCWALRPRYKRLVDNIFPENPEDGLVKANMEKLTFFALSAPEKLDRIAAYLSERLTRDLHRHRYGYVQIAVEALEQLLSACHSQSINLLVESFLRTLRLLLESERAQLHELATGAFVAFANIQEDSPSYHRSYDFFVSRFSQMCLCENEDQETQDRIRVSGIRGLQGVVRKTVDNEFHINIWEPQHMEQILPALMVNLQTENIHSGSPAEQTELCFRDLLSRAAYGHITNAIKPVLMHLDSHHLWEEDFAVHVFQIVMCSIQHSHLVVQLILGHLDANSRSAASVRTGIVQVLRAAVTKATGSIGPTVLEVFNTLLRQLRQSVDYELTGYYDNVGKRQTSSAEERELQDAVVHTIGSFAHTLPVYQRSEVMLFIMGKIPVPGMYPDLGSPTKGLEDLPYLSVFLLFRQHIWRIIMIQVDFDALNTSSLTL